MGILRIVGRWVFAVFLAAISFCISFLGVIFLGLKLQQYLASLGIQAGLVIAPSMTIIPVFVAVYVGSVTAPNAHLKIASIVFTLSAFLLMNALNGPHLYIQTFLETSAGCVIAAIFLYVRWKRQLQQRVSNQNARLIAEPGVEI